MAQLPVMDSNCVQLTFKHNADELVTVKRVKREPGAVTGKNVLVLKNSDVVTRGELVFMPNTIEMAQLKKSEKGQFKTNVQISSKMTEMDIKRILVENFPFLEYQRFWCASAVDNRTRLDFHGERRIWDGQAIKRKIKGNSALYILTEEDPKVSEQSTLKRSHDQITSVENEKSEQSSGEKAVAEDMNLKLLTSATAYPHLEKLAKLFAAGSSPKYVESNPNMEPSPGATETAAVKGTLLEKGGHLHPIEGQLQKRSDIVAGVQDSVYVTGQHGMISSVSHPSKSVSIQESRNVKDVVYTGAASSSHSIRMGTIMVPGGIVVAQPGLAHISTASNQQSQGKPVFHTADGHFEARHSGLPLVAHTVPHVMVSSTLTPQMSNLNISKGASMQFQKPVDVEKCTGKRNQSAQTEEGGDLSQRVFPVTMTAESNRSFADELCKKSASVQLHDVLRSLDQSKQTTDINTQCKSSELSDSGVETSDSLGEDISQPKEIYCNDAMKTQQQEKKVDNLDKAEHTTSGISGIEKGGDPLHMLSDIASNAPKVPVVKQICPNSGPVMGGIEFMLVLDEHLPADVECGHVYFGDRGPVVVKKINGFNMAGTVPAANWPGLVTVTVQRSDGQFLGETYFNYIDDVEKVLELLLHNKNLQARYFRLLAEELVKWPSGIEKKQSSEPSCLKNTGSERIARTSNLFRQFLIMNQVLQMDVGGSANCPSVEHCVFENPRYVNESDYDSDDEASDSSVEGDVSCYKGDFDPKFKTVSRKTVTTDANETGKIDNRGINQDTDDARKLGVRQLSEAPTNQNTTNQATSSGSLWHENNHIRDGYGEEKILEQLEFISLLTTEDVAIKDNIEYLSLNLQESEPATSPLDSAVSPLSRKDTETRALVSQGERKELPERSNMPGNTEFIHEQLNADLDENSVSDKTRRSNCVIKGNQVDNRPAADL